MSHRTHPFPAILVVLSTCIAMPAIADDGGRMLYDFARPDAAPVRMRPSQSASITARGRPSDASNRPTQKRAPARLTVYDLKPTSPWEGRAADMVARTVPPATLRLGWF